jgi:phage-related protein
MEGGEPVRRISDMYMRFKGISNDDVGVRLLSPPIRQVTAVRAKKQNLPGRDGYITTPDGWQEVTVRIDVAVPDRDDLPAAKRWLTGSGELVFGDDPARVMDAAVLSPLPLQAIARRLEGQKCTVVFTCQPFLRQLNEAPIVLTSGSVFNGQGDVRAFPLICVEGDGEQDLIVNGRRMTLALTDGVPLYIDCDAGTAYVLKDDAPYDATRTYEVGDTCTHDGDLYRCVQEIATPEAWTYSHWIRELYDKDFAGDRVSVLDDWFELNPASEDVADHNNVNFTSGIDKVTITPRWRYY